MLIVERALGGSRARKFRTVLPDLGEKGEKVVVTEVRYLVSIAATGGGMGVLKGDGVGDEVGGSNGGYVLRRGVRVIGS